MARLISTGLGDLLPMTRSEGRHVSLAIRRLCIQLGHFDDSPLPEDRTLLELGSAFEDLLAGALAARVERSDPGRYIRPGEQECDGIFGTPDLYDLTDHAVIEVKFTRLSTKHDPESTKFWKYWKQLQAYCHMMGTRRGRLHIIHINGDYKFGSLGSAPTYRVWGPDHGEFEESEIADTWSLIKAYS